MFACQQWRISNNFSNVSPRPWFEIPIPKFSKLIAALKYACDPVCIGIGHRLRMLQAVSTCRDDVSKHHIASRSLITLFALPRLIPMLTSSSTVADTKVKPSILFDLKMGTRAAFPFWSNQFCTSSFVQSAIRVFCVCGYILWSAFGIVVLSTSLGRMAASRTLDSGADAWIWRWGARPLGLFDCDLCKDLVRTDVNRTSIESTQPNPLRPMKEIPVYIKGRSNWS